MLEIILKYAYECLGKDHLRDIGVPYLLKCTLCRNKLSKLYVTFVRPLLEYASVVWDGCSSAKIEKLEKEQLHAARIVTGLPIFASKDSMYMYMYLETGWDPLCKRREMPS
jgi:hypothetical protein